MNLQDAIKRLEEVTGELRQMNDDMGASALYVHKTELGFLPIELDVFYAAEPEDKGTGAPGWVEIHKVKLGALDITSELPKDWLGGLEDVLMEKVFGPNWRATL